MILVKIDEVLTMVILLSASRIGVTNYLQSQNTII